MGQTDVSNLREDYQRGKLERSDVAQDPIEQFRAWIEAAIADEIAEPNAMVLATVDAEDMPNARVVLLKDYSAEGFVFYTNYDSTKGHELAEHRGAALCFNWLEHQRQVRIRGHVRKVSRETTEAYYHSRPKGSQIGAWASPQSEVIVDREVLERKERALQEKYAGANALPVPPHWGGYRVEPVEIEFWQGRSSRLHDRFRYLKTEGGWTIDRLAP